MRILPRSRAAFCPLFVLFISLFSVATAQRDTSSLVTSLELRGIGPALMSGRIADIAVDPVKPHTWYVAVGSGGIFKTKNAGTTWKPIFDDYGSYSIGCVTIDPSARHTIWVGTGEAVGGRHVGYGDGVYVSHDGGDSFTNVGLKDSEHIAKILIDPHDSNTVYVAAQGPLWSKGGERGLYKTTDGGKTWNCILSKGPYTGVTDIALDPRDPHVLFAATHQRHRTVWALINAGPESGIFKSTDAGASWQQLKKGLPIEDMGKIALGVSPHNSNVVYASIELAGLRTRRGGLWRSEDAGASWSKQSDFISGGTGPHYYQEIWIDPHREGVLYQADVMLARSEDRGKTWNTVASRAKHVDNHAVAFHPSDPDFLLVGCDGGVYRSYDRGGNYQFISNLPLTQFYKLDVGNDYPIYHVVGGTQDNGTQYGPTRTSDRSGIRNSDWRIVLGSDGHDCAIDPEDPDIIYCETQMGYIARFDRRTGETVDIRPQPEPGEAEFRFNWDSPILISPHSHTRIYFGSNRLHRSDDRGDSWTTISPDLSRQRDRFQLQVMDRVWSIDAAYDLLAMSQYGNITSISESPLEEDLVYVGTDDGLVHVTEDGGEIWRDITPDYEVPDEAFVNDVKADRHDADTVYVVFDAHKVGDFSPYVLKSTNRGQTWAAIMGDLPERHIVWRFEQDHEVAELCFLGTEFGIFATINGGEHWVKFSSGAPNIPFRDLAIQRRENDLVGASFGRGFFVLDDYSPLRKLASGDHQDSDLYMFPVRDALLYARDSLLGSPRGSQGDALYAAANPPYGAVFTYYLKEGLETRKSQRSTREKKIKAEGGDVEKPTWDELEQEEIEEQPEIFFTVTESDGDIVTRVTGSASAGLHRITWNLRYANRTSGGGPERSARGQSQGGRGPRVLPGEYTVQASKLVDGQSTELGQPVTFQVVAVGKTSLPPADPEETLAFQMEVAKLQQTFAAARELMRQSNQELEGMKQALVRARAPTGELDKELQQIVLQLRELEKLVSGDATKDRYLELTPRSISDRLATVMGASRSRYGPTATHRREYEIVKQSVAQLVPQLEKLRNEDLEQLKRRLDEAGVPWSTGRATPPVP